MDAMTDGHPLRMLIGRDLFRWLGASECIRCSWAEIRRMRITR